MRGAVEGWGLWLCLALGLALSVVAVCLRPPLPADAPPSAFSAGRALADVRMIGAEPHPIGSAANDRVRASLLSRMTEMGLQPQVIEGVGVYVPKGVPSEVSAGTTRSLLGVIPGRDRRTPALALMAHFDSVPNSPGAADDGAGVATVLEIARTLQATGVHDRDVLVILTDGEEEGLLGVDALFHDPRVRPRIGAVVNFDTRGDAGRAAMFETGPGAGETIRLYARAARAPFANSLTAYIYHLLPNDTDFTLAYRAGLPGLNFAFTDDQLAYHTPLATPEHLSKQSLQHMGDQAAPAALALADAPSLPARGADLAYFDLFGQALVAYPPEAGWGLTLGAGLLAALAWAGLRRDPVRRGEAGVFDVLRGAAVAVAATAAAALAGGVAGRMLGGAGYVGGYRLYREFDRLFWGAGLLALGAGLLVVAVAARARGGKRLAAVAVVAALLSFLQGFDGMTAGLATVVAAASVWAARRPLPPWAGWLGALLALGVAAVALQAVAPLAAPLVAWPFLMAALAAAICAWTPRRAQIAAFAGAGGLCVIALAALGAVANGVFTAVGPGMPGVLALFVLLALPGLAPFAYAWGARRGATAIAAGGLALGAVLLVLVARAPGTPDRPAPTQALYLADASGAQHRVAPLPRLDAWTLAVLAGPGGALMTREPLPPLFSKPAWSAPALGPPLAPPGLDLSRGGGGVVMLTARPTGGGRSLRILLRSPGAITRLSVQGRPVPLVGAPGRWVAVAYAAPPPTGVTLTFTLGAVEAQVFEQRDGWPPGASPPPKPPGLMAFGDSDSTLVAARAAIP